jgi:hypothetical protein
MTGQERLAHVVAFEAARRIEEVLAIPRSKRAMVFFRLFQTVKRGLEEFIVRSKERENRLPPGND